MSNNVDTRIVEMQFDNKQFEKHVRTSVESLELLKKSLDLEKAAKGLDVLDKAFTNFSLKRITEGMDALRDDVSVLGKMKDRIIGNITDSMINASRQIVLTMSASVRSGFSEYETQINAIQTILANTSDAMTKAGYSEQQRLDLVKDKLDELNHYADKTIYNFTEMTNNIGRFTAAGIELNAAVDSIQGIANLAAVSGSTSQQASTAMYQLSQALSTGTLKLQDWNSVVNAGMGGEIFQKALIRTADAMGVTGEKATEMFSKLKAGEVSFRDSLSGGWITSDVLTETLYQISWDLQEIADLNGITLDQAKEIKRAELYSKGYGKDAAEEILNLAETATDAATKVKTMTQLVDTLKESAQSGWTQTWEYIIGDFGEAKELFTEISDHFGKIIEQSSDSRNAIVKEWKDLGGRQAIIDSFRNVIDSLENITVRFKNAFTEVFPSTTGKQLFDASEKIKNLTEQLKNLTENSEVMGKLDRGFKGIANAAGLVRTGLKYVIKELSSLFGIASVSSFSFLDMFASIGDWLTSFKLQISSSERFKNVLSKLGNALKSVKTIITDSVKAIGRLFINVGEDINNYNIFQIILSGIEKFLDGVPKAVSTIRSLGKSFVDYVRQSDFLMKSVSAVKGYIISICEVLKQYGSKIKDSLDIFVGDSDADNRPFGEKLKARFEEFASNFGTWFDRVKQSVTDSWTKIRDFFTDFINKTVPDFFNSTEAGFNNIISKIAGIDWLKVIRTAFGIYAGFKALELVKGFLDIGSGIKKMGAGLKALGKGIKDISKNGIEISHTESIGTTLLKIAGSIAVMVGAIYLLAKLPDDDLKKGLGLVALIAGGLLSIAAIFKMIKIDGKSFLQTAGAIALMVIPIAILSKMDPAAALKGIFAIGIILTEMAIFARIAGKGFEGKNPFIGVAFAIDLLAVAIYGLSKIPATGLIKSLAALSILLLELGVFMRMTKDAGKISGMISMAIGLNLFVLAMKSIGNMDTEAIVKSVISIGVILLSIGGMFKLANGIKLGNAITLVATIGLIVAGFVYALQQLEGYDALSMISFAGSISVLMIAFAGALKSISSIDAASATKGALGSIVGAVVLIGGIMAAFVVAMNAIENDDPESMIAFATSIGELMLAFAGAMKVVSMIPFGGAIQGAGGAIVAFAEIIAGAVIILGVLGELYELYPHGKELIQNGGEILEEIGIALGKGISGVLGGLTDTLPMIGENISGFATNLAPFIDAMSKIDTSVLSGAGALSGAILAITGTEFIEKITSLFAGESVVARFGANVSLLGDALSDFATSVSTIKSANQAQINNAITTANGLVGVVNALPAENGFLQKIVGAKRLGGFASDISKFGRALRSFSDSISNLKTIDDGSITVATKLSNGLVNVINSIPESGGFLQKIVGAKDLGAFATDIPNFGIALQAFGAAISGFATVSEDDVGSAIRTATALRDFSGTLEDTGGWIQAIVGQSDMSSFGTQCEKIGAGLQSFATNIAGVSVEDATSATTVLDMIRTFSESLGETGGVWSNISEWFGGKKDLVGLSTDLSTFGTNFKTFSDGISSAASAVTDFGVVQTIIQSFADLTKSVKDGEIDATGIYETAYLIGDAFVLSFGEAIQNGADEVYAASSQTSIYGTEGANSTLSQWIRTGRNLALGIRDGILAMTSAVASAARSVASSALNSIQMTWSVHSPSKVGYELGQFLDLGLMGGIESASDKVTGSVEVMAHSVIESAKTLLRDVNSSIFDYIDPNPTIRPLIDLSNVQTGIGSMNQLFASSPVMGPGFFSGSSFTRGMSGLRYEGQKLSGSTDNRDMVGELQILNDRFDNLSKAVTNMKLVLDTGTLVGKTSAKMDNQLGKLAMRRERGN